MTAAYLPPGLKRYAPMADAMFECTLWLIAAIILPDQGDKLLYALAAGIAAFGSPLRGLQMLTVQILLLHFNSPLTGWGGSGGLHLLTPVILLLKVFLHPGQRRYFFRDRALVLILCIAPVFMGFQALYSSFPGLSISKAALFFVYALAALFLSKWSFRRERLRLIQWYLGTILFLIVSSLPLLLMPGGYFMNGIGFNGILLHPNALGMIVGIGVAYLLAQAGTGRNLRWGLVIVGVIGLIEVYLSQSRGGLFSCILALGSFVCVKIGTNERAANRLLQRSWFLIFGAIPLLVLVSGTVQQSATNFLTKARTDEASFLAAFDSARGGAIELHLMMFHEKPWTGHGFQVVNAWTSGGFENLSRSNSTGLINESLIVYDPITGKIPISAPVETAFLYTSILAENGIIGGSLAFGVMLIVAIPILRGPKNPEFLLLIAVLLSNVSEASFFSPSGQGGWSWLMLGLAYASATVPRRSKLQAEKRRIVRRVGEIPAGQDPAQEAVGQPA